MCARSGGLRPYLAPEAVLHGGRQQAIHGSRSCAANHQKGRRRQQEEVVFITFSLLCSRPVHPEAELTMNHRDGHDHVAKNSKGRKASEQSEDETQSAEEFCGDGQKCEYGRNVQDSREEAHRAGEAITTEPSEHLLGAVGEEDHSEHQSKNSRSTVVVGGDQFTKHKNSLRRKFRCPAWGKQHMRLLSLYKDSFHRGTSESTDAGQERGALRRNSSSVLPRSLVFPAIAPHPIPRVLKT